MLGRRIKVLQKAPTEGSSGKLKDAEITAFEWSKYTLTYASGNSEKWDLSGLKEWHLLPEPATMAAGPVDVHDVHRSDLVGLNALWAVALHDLDDSVAQCAADLLLALHHGMGEVEATVLQRADSDLSTTVSMNTDQDDEEETEDTPDLQCYAVDDVIDVQLHHKDRGYYEWCPAQVVGQSGSMIRVRPFDDYNQLDEEAEELIDLKTEATSGVKDERGTPGPRIAVFGSMNASSEKLIYANSTHLPDGWNRRLQGVDIPVVREDHRSSLINNAIEALSRAHNKAVTTRKEGCEGKDAGKGPVDSSIWGRPVRRAVSLMASFCERYAQNAKEKSHGGSGRGRWVKFKVGIHPHSVSHTGSHSTQVGGSREGPIKMKLHSKVVILHLSCQSIPKSKPNQS